MLHNFIMCIIYSATLVNSCRAEFSLGKIKTYLNFLSFLNTDITSRWMTRGRLSCIANIIAADDLATQGARASTAMALAELSRNVPVSSPERLIVVLIPCLDTMLCRLLCYDKYCICIVTLVGLGLKRLTKYLTQLVYDECCGLMGVKHSTNTLVASTVHWQDVRSRGWYKTFSQLRESPAEWICTSDLKSGRLQDWNYLSTERPFSLWAGLWVCGYILDPYGW